MSWVRWMVVVAVAALGLSLGGCDACKKKKAPATAAGSGSGSATGSGSAAGSGSATGSGSADELPLPPPAIADHVTVSAQPGDPAKPPVAVRFEKWTVKKATFDPSNLEGGTAEIELEVASVSTGITALDQHLNTPDFFDNAKFPTITIKIANVKRSGPDRYTADAAVTAHGTERMLSLSFNAFEPTATSIRISLSHRFSRRDFGIGPPQLDMVKADVTLDAVLTLTKP